MGHNAHLLLDFVHPETIAATVFREPVERLISHYYYACRTPEHGLHSVEDYVRSGLSRELRNWYTVHFTGLPVEEVEAHPEDAIGKALEVLTKRYAVIGFQDDLPGFVSKLARIVRLHKAFSNPIWNKTPNRPNLADIPPSVRRTIEEIDFVDVKFYSEIRKRFGGQ